MFTLFGLVLGTRARRRLQRQSEGTGQKRGTGKEKQGEEKGRKPRQPGHVVMDCKGVSDGTWGGFETRTPHLEYPAASTSSTPG